MYNVQVHEIRRFLAHVQAKLANFSDVHSNFDILDNFQKKFFEQQRYISRIEQNCTIFSSY